ncbi:helix-turn-helix domain-containing protein [Sinorhizobium prairiense]|uniref:helix-turn-helix domain-containing protein n=1 Tax=unclassified Sinorhizobium TaxID=2613772 RepID=UPI0023D8B6E6|nr:MULTISPECIES: LysR family transcriptional regulator [unclassified Sinorhizobium]WEJ08776.1 LysR family transcriptional regulator [Sinorhizobium sp. M103]WEJ14135.1 LysR family transcriptional regulator [Sinorhizobium sp. K101]WEJ35733.1 LysR family transcriptional regulator [Sinorhizobium sp. C101]
MWDHETRSDRAIQSLVAAGTRGSFLEAAAQLTPSAVSHQIRLMEGDLGEKLFHRIGRNVTPHRDRRYGITVTCPKRC